MEQGGTVRGAPALYTLGELKIPPGVADYEVRGPDCGRVPMDLNGYLYLM